MRNFAVTLGLLLAATPVSATTLVVRADHTGPFPTIQAAVDAAVNGDVVELEDGVFTDDGNRDVDLLGKTVTIRSATGQPESCVIDCEGSSGFPHRGFWLRGGSTLESLTIRNGWQPYSGGAVDAQPNATIRHCIFHANQTGGDGWGGAIAMNGPGSILDSQFTGNHAPSGGAVEVWAGVAIEGCFFGGNSAGTGGAISASDQCTIRGCELRGNESAFGGAISLGEYSLLESCLLDGNSAASGGAVWISDRGATVRRCTIVGNHGEQGGAFATGGGGSATISNCTVYGNSATWGSFFYADGAATTTVENCIVASNLMGPTIYRNSSYHVNCSCTDLFGNEGGDWPGGEDGNINLDPLFCDAAAGDFTLRDGSPCAPFSPPNPECDLSGAWPVACEPTPALETSWGKLKANYR